MELAAIFLLGIAATWAQDIDSLVEHGHYNRAKPLVEQRLKTNPKDARAQYLLGRIKFAGGEYEGAIENLELASSLEPNNAEYHSLLGQLYGRHAEQASILKRLGLAKKCKAEIEQAVKIDPTNLEANFTLMMYLSRAPGFIGGDKKRAQSIPDELAKKDPVKAWLVRAQFAAEANQPDKTEEYYRKAVEADPNNFVARWRYAEALFKRNPPNLEEAEKQGEAAKELNAQHIMPYRILVMTYAASDRYGDLEETLKEAEKAVPDDRAPYYDAARVLSKRGKELARAEAYIKHYVEQQPEVGAPSHAHAQALRYNRR